MKKHSCWYLLLILPILLTVPAIHRQLRKHVLKPDVTVTGFIKMADGLGRQSIELIDTLHNHFDVHFQKTRDMEWRDVPLHLHKILKDRSRPLGRVVILEDSLFEIKKAPKDLFRKRHNDQIWLAYSMFETSKAPPTFAHLIEEHFDAVLLPDPFLVKAYQAAGIQKPLFVLPLGLDLAPFLQAPLKTRKNTPFVFANFSTWENRKNQLMLVRAFAKAFGNRPDVFLKLNARRSAPEELAKLQEEITRLNLSNISFTLDAVDNPTYLKNFQAIDCYVNLSKGEGFSIQPREAMALGIPTIVSDNTAQSTLCRSGLVRSVPSLIEEKAYFEGLPNEDYGNFFNVHLEDVVEALLDVYENYDRYLQNAPKSREWVRQYQYAMLSPLYINLVKPKKLVLGKENLLTADCLMTNSSLLYQKYLKLYPELKAL